MTNQLFRDYLDGRMSGHQTPTFAFIEIHANTDTFVEGLRLAGEAIRFMTDQIRKPAPAPPWAGNLATQKRRRKL